MAVSIATMTGLYMVHQWRTTYSARNPVFYTLMTKGNHQSFIQIDHALSHMRSMSNRTNDVICFFFHNTIDVRDLTPDMRGELYNLLEYVYGSIIEDVLNLVYRIVEL